MKHRQKTAWFLSGVLATVLASLMISPALALLAKTIQVHSGVNIYVDDKEFVPKGYDGNPLETFIYDGTTYLPIRAVSEALGKPVQWDGSTLSVYIGKHTGSTPVAWLAEMDYFQEGYSSTDWEYDKKIKDNLGNEHIHSLFIDSRYSNGEGFVKYKLNAQYSRLTASFFQKYSYRNSTTIQELVISGDGKELWSGSLSGGMDPIDIDIDLTGVLELEIEVVGGHIALGDVALWT